MNSLLRLLAGEAWDNLWAIGRRSLLALIGIVIGTGSVIAMVNIGHSASEESLRQLRSLGTDLLVIRRGDGTGAESVIDMTDAIKVKDSVLHLTVASPLAMATIELGRERMPTTIIGARSDLAEAAKLEINTGRFLTQFDRFDTYAVIGTRIALAHSTRLRIGTPILIGRYRFQVVGILKETVPNPLLPFNPNESVFIPLEAMRRIGHASDVETVLARVAGGNDPNAVAAQVVGYFQAAKHHGTVAVQSARQLIESMEEQARLYTMLLAAIGGISLIVGGVGVMNVMLMSVSERRREIGLRMALGARPSHIRIMFLLEAVILSLAGGVAGILMGTVAAYAFSVAYGWAFSYAQGSLPLGLLIACGVGITFGYYPASNASNLDPVEALRSE